MSPEYRPKVVIVNDEAEFLELAAALLRDAGFDVTTCDQPRQCHQVIRDVRPTWRSWTRGCGTSMTGTS